MTLPKLYMNRTPHRSIPGSGGDMVLGVLFFRPKKRWQKAIAYALGHTYTHVSICYSSLGVDYVIDYPKKKKAELLNRADFMRKTEPSEIFVTQARGEDVASAISLCYLPPFSRAHLLLWLIAKRFRLPVGSAPRSCTSVTRAALPHIPHNTPDELHDRLKKDSARIA